MAIRLKIRKAILDPDVCLNGLIYGATGAGKTTLLGTAVECEYTSPPLFMAVDPGTLSIAGSGIDVVRPRNFNEVQEIYDFMRYENRKYRSILIDSLTVTQRNLSMYELLGVLDENEGYGKLADATPPRQYDWLSSGEQMRRFISAFRDLAYLTDKKRRVHVFFAAMEKVDEKSNSICPSLPGQLAIEVGGHVDLMARLTIEEAETSSGRLLKLRHLQMVEEEGDGHTILAKIRTPWKATAPGEIWRPTVDKLITTWFSGVQRG